MLDALTPTGHLVLTGPYHHESYVPNAYALPDLMYRTDDYICQQFSRHEFCRWFLERSVHAEYWRLFRGEYWAQIGHLERFEETSPERAHLICASISARP